MKKKHLVDVIFASDKRKRVLLMLKDEPQEMKNLLKELDTNRPALLPQMRILKDHSLIYHSGDVYGLTTIGKIVVDEMKPFLDTIETLCKHNHYLSTHNTDSIPKEFLKRISSIKGSHIIEPNIVNTHEMNSDYLKVALASKAVYFVFTFMHPACPSILKQLADKNINVEIIFTRGLVDKLLEGWSDEFRHFIAYDNIKFYLHEQKVGISSLTVTDAGFLLRLLFNNGDFSNKQMLCLSPQGRQWGKELYDYYLKNAKPITHV
ncbi:winged helix-turn-helix domain-containing protein [uncultured Methanolobus sp.]|uniref:helix-turn-helix transcriptional regulator n=1 Tax=uncultured Methanolobus sp. TaxID=218300 RepID=UPI002AAC146B|nr:winged helix-turn-helix domain-containing protein [uncultured Methanolobus sp.]